MFREIMGKKKNIDKVKTLQYNIEQKMFPNQGVFCPIREHLVNSIKRVIARSFYTPYSGILNIVRNRE
jgi:hypothetical protein